MPWNTRPISPKCRSGWGTRTYQRRVCMTAGKPSPKTARRFVSNINELDITICDLHFTMKQRVQNIAKERVLFIREDYRRIYVNSGSRFSARELFIFLRPDITDRLF